MGGQRFGHALTVLGAGPRHRHQNLHGHVRRHRTAAHLLLHAFGKQLDQRQPVRHPTQAAIKAAGQLLQAVTETPLQFPQQPAFFQRGSAFRHAQRTIQHQRLGLAQRPNHGFDRVPTQPLQGGDALVAVDHQVTIRLFRDCHHDDRRLLSRAGQRRQQAPLPLRPPHSQVLPAPLQLVKLQSHRPFPCCSSYRASPSRTP